MSKYGEPWNLGNTGTVRYADGGLVGTLVDCERIVACVNACAGLNPEAIKELVRAAEAMLDADGFVADIAVIDRLRAAFCAVMGETP